MPHINLSTRIFAPINRCFDLARSIDVHLASCAWTDEEAIAGVTTGLIGLGEETTWRGKHLGLTQTLTSRVTRYERPYYFQDSQVQGIFRHFDHEHRFEHLSGETIMNDRLDWDSPYGLLGRVADLLVVKRYLYFLLETRNSFLKRVAESDEWQIFLS
jgi:ligand-binding SRPBCC domain-containing protein